MSNAGASCFSVGLTRVSRLTRALALAGLVVGFAGCDGAAGGASGGGGESSGGGGGGESSGGGDTPPECPADLLAALGTPCTSEGQSCHATPQAMRFIMCSGGVWTEVAMAPLPSGDEGDTRPTPTPSE